MLELDIKSKPFPSRFDRHAYPDAEQLNYEENEKLKTNHLKRDKALSPGLVLLLHAFEKILGHQWSLRQDDDLYDPDRQTKRQYLREFGMFRGKYLYKYGMKDLLRMVLSEGALTYVLKTGIFYEMINKNASKANIYQ